MMTVWATYHNSDMTEGRGPMVLDKVFTQEEDAHAYTMTQDGVMGRNPKDFGNTSWEGIGDWKVEPIHVLDGLDDALAYDEERNLRKAYQKLTADELAAIRAHLIRSTT